MNIIYHSNKNTVASFSHNLASILGVKVSRARELHAKALEFNSNSHLVASLAGYRSDVGMSLERYFLNLSELLQAKHHKTLSDEMMSLIVSDLSSDIGEVYANISVEDFIRFALIKGGSNRPLAGFNDLSGYAHNLLKGDMRKHVYVDIFETAPLVSFLTTGVVSDLLKQMVGIYFDYLGFKSKVELSQMLEWYKEALHTHASSKLIHTYVVPLIARFDVNARSLGSVNVAEVSEICATDSRAVLMAEKAESGDHCSYGDEDLVSAYCHPSGFFDARKKREYAISVTPPKESAAQIGKRNFVPMFITGDARDIHFHIVDTPEGSDDVRSYQEQTKIVRSENKPVRGYILYYPLMIVGKKLSVTQVRALNNVFGNMGQSSRKNGVDVAVGSLVSDSFSELINEDMGVIYNRALINSSVKGITELHQSWFELFPNTKWVFESIAVCYLTFVSKDTMYSPFGQYGYACHIELGKGSLEVSSISDERYCDRNVWLYALHQYCKNPVNHSITLYDNLDDSKCSTKTQRYIKCDDMPATSRKIYSRFEDILVDYDFTSVFNLIVAYERHDMSYCPFNLVGFDMNGEQVINITIYPFTIWSQSPATQEAFTFLGSVYSKIKGEHTEYEMEDPGSIELGNGLIACINPTYDEFEANDNWE